MVTGDFPFTSYIKRTLSGALLIFDRNAYFRRRHPHDGIACCQRPRFDSLASISAASYDARHTASRYDRHSLNHSLGAIYIKGVLAAIIEIQKSEFTNRGNRQ